MTAGMLQAPMQASLQASSTTPLPAPATVTRPDQQHKKLLKVLTHRPWVLPLAVVAAVVMVALGEVGYWQWMASLHVLAMEAQTLDVATLAQHRADLLRTLMLARVGVAVLSVICLVALYWVMRQGLALQRVALAHAATLEATVQQRTGELRELTEHLQTAREDERSRLARDLHDELGSLLTAAKLDAARIRTRLVGLGGVAGGVVASAKDVVMSVPVTGLSDALDRLHHLVQMLDSVIALKRRITEDLHPSSLRLLGLVPTLQTLAREYTEVSGTPVHCELQPVPLSPSAELMVYRLVQEALNNISKHAQARQVWLRLGLLPDDACTQQPGPVQLLVRDDGVGFDAQLQPRSAHGLLGMRYRVQAEQGSLQLSTAPGRGTRIDVRLPAQGATIEAAVC